MASEAIVKAIDDATAEIERVLEKCAPAALAQMPAMRQAVTLAGGVQALRKALSDELVGRVFMPLQGSPLGFLTDKDQNGGYPIATVRDCLIEGMIRGLQPVNNEINIISGRMYAAKNGVRRLVMHWPGLTDLRITPGVPQMAGDRGALIAMRATWKLNGTPMELYRGQTKSADGVIEDSRIAVRVNSGMGPDAIIGKAERKIFKAIHEILTNGTTTLEDGEAIDTVGETVTAETPRAEASPPPAPPEQDGRRIRIGKKEEPQPSREPGVGPNGEPT
jgi:hypothetical protein